MKTTIIKIDASDDILSIRDKIQWSNSQRIILVIPRKRRNFLDETGLTLINRTAKANGAQLGLVTWQDNIREAAERMGVGFFRSLLQAEREPWGKISEKTRQSERKSFEEIIRLKKELPVVSNASKPKRPSKIIIITSTVVIFLLLCVVFIPSSRVVIYPITSQQELTLEIKASPKYSLNMISATIPASKQILTLTDDMSAISSGSVKQGVTKAKGEIRVINLTAQEIYLPEGSVFSTPSPDSVEFVSLREIGIPGDGSEAFVPVEAVLAGESGNVDEGDITLLEGILGSSLSVTNESPTSGGSSIILPAPDESDYDKLYGKMVSELKQKALEQSQMENTEDIQPILQSLSLVNIIEETRHDPIGEPSDTLSMSMTAQFSFLFYGENDLMQVISESLDVALPENYIAVDNDLSIELIGVPEMTSEDEVVMVFHASRYTRKEFSEESLRRKLIGKNIDQAIELINSEIPHYRAAEVEPSINWWPYIPVLPDRIHFELRISNEG